MSTCARVIAIATLGSLALSTAYAAPDDSVQQSAEGKWGKNFRYEIPTTGRLDKECGVIMEIIKRPKDSPTSAGEKIFLGGLKSEVQHLASGKVPRCRTERRTDNFKLKSA